MFTMVSVIALSGCASVPSTSLIAAGGTVALGRTAKLDSRSKVFGSLLTEMNAAIPATAARLTTARTRQMGGGTRLRRARASLGETQAARKRCRRSRTRRRPRQGSRASLAGSPRRPGTRTTRVSGSRTRRAPCSASARGPARWASAPGRAPCSCSVRGPVPCSASLTSRSHIRLRGSSSGLAGPADSPSLRLELSREAPVRSRTCSLFGFRFPADSSPRSPLESTPLCSPFDSAASGFPFEFAASCVPFPFAASGLRRWLRGLANHASGSASRARTAGSRPGALSRPFHARRVGLAASGRLASRTSTSRYVPSGCLAFLVEKFQVVDVLPCRHVRSAVGRRATRGL